MVSKKKYRPAVLFEKTKNGIRCLVCIRECLVKEGTSGFCKLYFSKKEKLYTLAWGKVIATEVAPIEKAHIYHFLPGSKAFFVYLPGDSLLQNESIFKSEDELIGKNILPEKLANMAKKKKVKTIVFGEDATYHFEYVLRVARAAKRVGIRSIAITQGLINPAAVKKWSKYIDGILVKLKASLSPGFYSNFLNIRNVNLIKQVLKQIIKSRMHLEIVNEIIPQIGDDLMEVRKFAQWISNELGTSIPVHMVRFFPNERFPDLPATPLETLEKAIDEARSVGLRYVYIGNVPQHPDENTYCFNCRTLLIAREEFEVKEINLVHGRCPRCGIKIDVVMD